MIAALMNCKQKAAISCGLSPFASISRHLFSAAGKFQPQHNACPVNRLTSFQVKGRTKFRNADDIALVRLAQQTVGGTAAYVEGDELLLNKVKFPGGIKRRKDMPHLVGSLKKRHILSRRNASASPLAYQKAGHIRPLDVSWAD